MRLAEETNVHHKHFTPSRSQFRPSQTRVRICPSHDARLKIDIYQSQKMHKQETKNDQRIHQGKGT
jgi:hypothetical protein